MGKFLLRRGRKNAARRIRKIYKNGVPSGRDRAFLRQQVHGYVWAKRCNESMIAYFRTGLISSSKVEIIQRGWDRGNPVGANNHYWNMGKSDG